MEMAAQTTKKKQKLEDNNTITYKEEVLFNSDTLSKIISYLPSVELLNLALTCTRFGIGIGVSSSNNDNDTDDNNDKLSLIEDSARIAIQDIATEEQLAALPYYDGESSLADYHYLQFMRGPITFDHLVGGAEYVNETDKSCVTQSGHNWGTAISNNILMSGKHYVSFTSNKKDRYAGLIRPGKASQEATGIPLYYSFFQKFSRNTRHEEYNIEDSIDCCFYNKDNGVCESRDWDRSEWNVGPTRTTWEGMESMSPGDELGMLLDLDEGTLSVYKNGRKLGVMMRGLMGPYCWVASMWKGTIVTIKRGTIPPS